MCQSHVLLYILTNQNSSDKLFLMNVKLLSGALGAEIKGIDLTDISNPNFKKINTYASFIVLTITTPIIIKTKPMVVARFGICLYLKIPIKDKATIPTPDHVA